MRRFEIDKKEEEIVDLYVNQDKTMKQIADLFNSNKKSISRILKHNKVEIKRHKRKYSFYYEQKLSDKQKEILIGSLLGDGCVSKHHEGINSCRYLETHSIEQMDYSLWKQKEFKNFISSKYRIIDNTNTKTYGDKETIVFKTALHKDFVEFYNLFYIENIKRVPKNIESILSPLGLAVWFMDDGSCSGGIVRFSTYAFSEKGIDILRDMLKNKFKINSYKVNSEKGIVISLNKTESKKLIGIIKEHILESMSYKIKSSDNPVETEDNCPRASVLKCSEVNTFGSHTVSEMVV